MKDNPLTGINSETPCTVFFLRNKVTGTYFPTNSPSEEFTTVKAAEMCGNALGWSYEVIPHAFPRAK